MKPLKLLECMFRLVRLLFASALFIVFIPSSWASAQSTYDPWSEPLNLSHSGVTMNPASVIDSEGIVHVVWQDDLANFVYTRFDGDQWSAPVMTDLDRLFSLPLASESTSQSEMAIYTGPNPLFVASPGEYMYAFWISPQGKLFTSRVRNLGFQHVAAWDTASLIAPEVGSFAVAIDARGEWHLAFLRTADDPTNPPGIYYTRSKYNGRNWGVPVLLYESPYFRSLAEGEAHLSVATAGTEDATRVYVAWDNRPRKQVFLAQSADGGATWEQSALIAGPAPDSGSAGPFNIHVGANKHSVVLSWQSGRPDSACTQFYQSSNNGGATWSKPQPMLEKLPECPQSNEFVAGSVNNPRVPPQLYLLTETQTQVFLTAWNGLQWSEPQAQPILSGFEDPEIYTEVIYGCHRASLSEERLYIVGCDQGGGGDVWVTSRDLGPSTSWFSPPVWSQPSPVTDDHLETEAIALVATDDDLIHAFLGQREDSVIYYTYWDGKLWSPITPVLKLPDGNAGWPTIVAGRENELFLIAPSSSGAVYFSRATSGNAATESRWSAPAQLGIGHDGEIGSIDTAWDTAGTLYLAYSVPVNEERGIYLVQSKDYGASWSEPLQVFNGAAAGFDLVGAPSLLASGDGRLHIIWKQQSIQGDGIPQSLSLYYTRSEDGGRTFNDAKLLVDEPVTWQEIAADGKGNLHLFWQEQGGITTVWDQVSFDSGRSWQFPQGLPNDGNTATVLMDSGGGLHLLDVGQNALDHWLWNGSRWNDETSLRLPSISQREGPVELMATAANKQGKMVVLAAVPAGAGDTAERSLLYSTRTLELPPKETEIEQIPSLQPSPTAIPATATPELLLSPTAPVDNGIDNLQGQENRVDSAEPVNPFVRALLPVALLLLGVLSIVVWRASRVREQ